MPSLVPKTYNTSSNQPGYWEVNPLPDQLSFGSVTTLYGPIFSDVSFTLGTFAFYGVTAVKTSSVGVMDYYNHAFQASITGSSTAKGTGSITLFSTIDGYNFSQEYSLTGLNTATTFSLSAKKLSFKATYSGSNNATGSLYVVSSP
jgi:hypothetical protein